MTTYANVGHVLLKRGNTTQSSNYTGPLGELTYDTDLGTIRVHDNATPGGVNILATAGQLSSFASYTQNQINAINSGLATITGVDTTTLANLAAFETYANSAISTLQTTTRWNSTPAVSGCPIYAELTPDHFEAYTQQSHLRLLNNSYWDIGSNFTGSGIFGENGDATLYANGGNVYIRTNNSQSYFVFGQDGKLAVPQNRGVDINWTSDTASGGPGDHHYDSLRINNDHVTGLYITNTMDGTPSSWIFRKDGILTLPSNTLNINYANGQSILSGIGNNTGDITFSGGLITNINNNENIRIQVTGPDAPYQARSQLIWHANAESKYNTVFADATGVSIRNAQWSGPEDNYANYWQFTTNGDLTTPADTNIIASSGDLTLSANNVNITGNLDVQGSNGNFVVTFGPVPNNLRDFEVESVAAGPDGSIYVTGTNFNNNDPRWLRAPQGFLNKIDNTGKIVYEMSTAYLANTQQRPVSWGEGIRYNTHGLAVVFNDYTATSNISAALINPADGTITNQVYLSEPDGVGIIAADIDVDSSGSSIIAGSKSNETENYANVAITATAGGGTVIGVPASTFTGNVNDRPDGNGQWAISGNNISGTATIVGVNQFLAVPSTAVPPSAGVGATFNVTYDSNGAVVATVASGGIGGYQSNDQVTILGTNLGGASPANDIVLYVASDGTYVTGVNSVHTGTAQTTTVYLTIDQTDNFNVGDLYTIYHYVNNDGYISTANWRAYVGTDSYDYFETVSVDTGGNIFAGGSVINNQPWVVKFNSAGTLLWSKTIAVTGTTYGQVNGSVVDSMGNIITIMSDNSGQPAVTKQDTNGNIIWQRYMPSYQEMGGGSTDIAIDNSDNIYIGGSYGSYFSYVINGTLSDMLIVKFDTNGNVLWQNTLGTRGYEYDFYDYGCRAMAVAGDHVVIGGYSSGVSNTEHNHSNGFVAKIPADGTGQGTYGDWQYISTPFWNWYSSGATSADVAVHVITTTTQANTTQIWQNVSQPVTTKTTRFGGTGVITGVTEIVKTDGTPLAGPDSDWKNPNGNTWSIRTYNGAYSFTYSGLSAPVVWWDAANSPLGGSNFRGAVIEYHAYINGNANIVGSIVLAEDVTNPGEATHTENIQASQSGANISFWSRPGGNQLGYSNSGLGSGGQDTVMVMWTARVFYGSETYC